MKAGLRAGYREAAAIAAILLLVLLLGFHRQLEYTYENIMFALAPSAARAVAYGEKHFDAQHATQHDYDIDRAEYFYQKAVALDPGYFYVYHQIARIEFLRSNFNTALYYINKEISLHGDSEPNTYYIRGLIEGYMEKYDDAIRDYATYLQSDPHNWAAINDYAWVLLKAQRFQEAADATLAELTYFPDNPWLLNSRATALYELGRYKEAYSMVQRAEIGVAKLKESDWLIAYPGNDPKVAGDGLAAFRAAVAENMHTIEAHVATSTIQ